MLLTKEAIIRVYIVFPGISMETAIMTTKWKRPWIIKCKQRLYITFAADFSYWSLKGNQYGAVIGVYLGVLTRLVY